VQQGFRNDKMLTNGLLKDGRLVVFRGSDEKDRAVLLVLDVPSNGAESEAQKTQDQATPRDPSMQLSYIENANSPDVFRMKEGQF
jgi:hypothetical protein